MDLSSRTSEIKLPKSTGYDSLANWYTFLESLTFRNSLQKARLAHLHSLKNAHSILILGDGTGRFLLELLKINPHASIISIDSSNSMIEHARQRITTHLPQSIMQVTWIHADALAFDYSNFFFDAIVTQFFLDQFNHKKIERLTDQLVKQLNPNGSWYNVDYTAIINNPILKIRANIWLKVLYTFFQYYCKIEAKTLNNTHPIFRKYKLETSLSKKFSYGLIEARLWKSKGGFKRNLRPATVKA